MLKATEEDREREGGEREKELKREQKGRERREVRKRN
jgi:hypothetical protein